MRRLLGLTLALGVAGCSPEPLVHDFVAGLPAGPQVVAERCGHQEAPGNTAAGCATAAAAGASVLGVDVWLTADGVPVLAESDRLEDFTEGEGDLATRTLEELVALDAAYRWSPAEAAEEDPDEVRFPLRGAGYTVAPLAELLGGQTPLLIHIARPTTALVEALAGLLSEHSPAAYCLSTETTEGALQLQQALPEACMAFPPADLACLDWTRTVPLDWGPCRSWDIALAPAETEAGRLLLTRPFVERSQARGWPVFARTEGDAYLTELLLLLGVEAVVTPRPAEAVGVRERIAHEL